MVGAHTTNPIRGRMESHTFRGVAFLRTEFGCGYFVSKINLIFSDNVIGGF